MYAEDGLDHPHISIDTEREQKIKEVSGYFVRF